MTESETLLKSNPKATKVIKDWFLGKMIKSFQEAMPITEEMKQQMIDEGIEEEKLALLIEMNPRMLFDVLDDNGVHVAIVIMPFTSSDPTLYSYKVFADGKKKIDNEDGLLTWHPTRIIAESFAIEEAIELLNNKL